MLELVKTGEQGQPATGLYERSLRDAAIFSVTWELVSGRGAHEKAQENLLDTAEKAAAAGRVNALTITDNPGGNPALSGEMLGAEIVRLGIEPLVHLTCKDKNRNELESLLYGLERAGVRNLLVMTGDYPKAGYQGEAKPVFDLDAVTLLGLVQELNQGREVAAPKGMMRLKPAHFFAGVVASPFKALEAEQMGQYYKLKKKLEAGAQFVVSQVGYDARKFQELLMMVRLLGGDGIPVVGNIYLLTRTAARLMHANGVAGCVVPDKLMAEIEREAVEPDKGRSARNERGARMYAMLKGMGFAGAHISGMGMTLSDFEYVTGRGEELAANWQELVRAFDYPQKDGWYYFERDPETGLNRQALAVRGKRGRAGLAYQAMRALHAAMFKRKGIFFRPMGAVAKAVDGSALEGAYTKFEQIVKSITNNCMHCGDCALFDTAYLCPQSQCPKNQRNGPCGGSYMGACEKHPGERQCVYVRAYERLKSHGAEDALGSHAVPPVNYELYQTSSWLNFYLGRDHSAGKEGIETVARRKPKKDTREDA